MINLKNKYCLVTGCNGHTGSTISKKLRMLGAKVIGIDNKINKKKANLSFFIKVNLDNKNEIDKSIYVLNKRFSKIDILLNWFNFLYSGFLPKTLIYLLILLVGTFLTFMVQTKAI